MKLLAWNLNHRAARHRIPAWIASAIAVQAPDILVLVEYVEGPDHTDFRAALAAQGLCHAELTSRPPRQNQVLIATREPPRRRLLRVPEIDPSVPPNALEISLEQSGISVLGFRMPAFSGVDRRKKRAVWEWLLEQADRLREHAAVLVGDFNTAPGDPVADCGDCIAELSVRGWTHARPASGHSWRHTQSGAGRQIDHLFVSPSVEAQCAEYLWDFQQLAPTATPRTVGVPDHAMQAAEIKRRLAPVGVLSNAPPPPTSG